jgi:hypothetical protein
MARSAVREQLPGVGPTIKMEETYRALGWWNSTDDYCAWSFEVPADGAGEYRVTLEYSCADNSAGNTAVVEVAGQTLTGQVASSGGWDRFRGWNLGAVKLPEGTRLVVHAVDQAGPLVAASGLCRASIGWVKRALRAPTHAATTIGGKKSLPTPRVFRVGRRPPERPGPTLRLQCRHESS